ncbi:MAG: carboxymethylenebutenolidase [Oceanospirillaceae bacterium]|uniref:dienelactone hydrolase family protein n=1 Tax=unclassified Thalassolituus TaxID=2624967 RepID=UPI000C3C7DF0|nr:MULTISPECIES: dienelactone hydrolase family protein [unclassified Thalassolituus]MAS25044.1 carboxymethylenebutenolidase [Oceanospirillaceae bacterium]MAX98586.1 carboxymethylenebutenolidase [Oceanospirillaceae bacterium]MBL34347.1 carboxymethylenebutenolidase [Oceanospirillaceae bacterium]MBS51830.1 carboxymethylenebutenolidase [Oceanospirillaceae bacterium]|tara:strand:+ start:9739 stop:10437 length:699 start_codon:yes stop_codon:yes gene_type:complete
MTTQWINISKDGDKEFNGYLALPPTGKGPGLILLQEIWGVNDHIKAVADQYAKSGFVVLAPDVFWRAEHQVSLNYDEAGTEKAFQLMTDLDKDQAVTDLVKAVDKLKSLPEVIGKTGIMGYCMGGMLSFRTAAATDLDAAVCYYGGGIANYIDEAANVHNPIMFHHGLQDQLIPEEARESIRKHFVVRKDAVLYDYEADHGFNCWGRPMYDQGSAAIAQGRTLRFLGQYLSE